MPVRYFQGVDDDYYFAVDGENGENVVTSEGYTTESDARRGYAALERAIARNRFAPDWPHGIAVFDGLPLFLGHAQSGEVVKAERQPSRLEGGPVQFGDDWPGLWLRGDACFAYALALRSMLADKSDAFARAGVNGLITALESTNLNRRGASSQ